MAGLLSAFGGGFGGNDSGVSASTPFYNESGIYFNSPGAGVINGGESTASLSPRQTSGGSNAIADSLIPNGGFSLDQPSNIIYYVIGAVILLAIGGYLAFKKS